MPVPPPITDPSHIEQRLLILAEILDSAVAEVRRVAAQIQTAEPLTADAKDGDADD